MKNKFFCLPAIPLLFQLAVPLKYISFLLITGFLIFLILRSVKRIEGKRVVMDSLFWILSVIILASITFAVSADFYFNTTSYLLIYLFSLTVLFIGFLILRLFSFAKIKTITFITLGLFLVVFIAMHCWKIYIDSFDQYGPQTTGLETSVFSIPMGGCDGITLF
jgi:hypothetical protein